MEMFSVWSWIHEDSWCQERQSTFSWVLCLWRHLFLDFSVVSVMLNKVTLVSMYCLFHNSTGSLKVRFVSHVELFTQTKPELGKWNNRDKYSGITCVFYKRLKMPRKLVSPGIRKSWILKITLLQWQIKKNYIWWTRQNWDSVFNKQQSAIGNET